MNVSRTVTTTTKCTYLIMFRFSFIFDRFLYVSVKHSMKHSVTQNCIVCLYPREKPTGETSIWYLELSTVLNPPFSCRSEALGSRVRFQDQVRLEDKGEVILLLLWRYTPYFTNRVINCVSFVNDLPLIKLLRFIIIACTSFLDQDSINLYI